ncbi:hypothetical protein AbraIFM66951_002313 [Aspergillus brasiliensis]|nr:hypothetical protein AbraIFM66951_002313 [Aspergillus brasiliensis]
MSPRKPTRAPTKPQPQPVTTGRITRSRKPTTHSLRSPTLTRLAKPAENETVQEQQEQEIEGHPPAWAESRPELCDALPWFRSVQGGVYHNGNICWGFLIDADCGIRSYLDDEVVITRV